MLPRSDRAFSHRGAAPTEFECALVLSAIAHSADTPQRFADSPWLPIAARIGVPALAVVFDEIGGEKVHVPTRAMFFEGLAQVQRDARILELLGQGLPQVTIATQFGLTQGRVSQIARGLKPGGRR